jgi:hypothetical protein
MRSSFQDILDAYELVSVGGPITIEAYLCRQTGKIYVRSDDYEDPDEELPEDLEDGEKYIALPSKHDLDLGKHLVLNFARDILPDDFDRTRDIFGKRGAYSRFKDLLDHRGAFLTTSVRSIS